MDDSFAVEVGRHQGTGVWLDGDGRTACEKAPLPVLVKSSGEGIPFEPSTTRMSRCHVTRDICDAQGIRRGRGPVGHRISKALERAPWSRWPSVTAAVCVQPLRVPARSAVRGPVLKFTSTASR